MQPTDNNEGTRKTLNDRFDQLALTIDDLRSRIREAQHEARAKLELQLAECERQQREAKVKLREFRSDSSDAWATFKAGMETTWNDLRKTIEDTYSEFKKP